MKYFLFEISANKFKHNSIINDAIEQMNTNAAIGKVDLFSTK